MVEYEWIYILYTHPPSSTEYSGEVVWICQAKAPLTCLAHGIPVEVNFQETSILDTCRKRTGVLHLRLLLLFVLMSAWFYEIVFTSATSAKCLTVFLHKCRSLITLIINSSSFPFPVLLANDIIKLVKLHNKATVKSD